MKLVNVEEMRAIEQGTDARGHSYAAMMDMAGRAVAETAMSLMLREPGKHVLILVGPGNNGGDGIVAARYLVDNNTGVTVYLWRRDIKGDKNFQQLKRTGRRRRLDILWADNDPDYAHLREQLQTADLVIDALLGTGVSRPIEGKLVEILSVLKEEVQARRAMPAVPPDTELSHPLQLPMAEAFALGLDFPGNHPGHDDDSWDDFDDWDDEDLDDEAGDDYDDLPDFDDMFDEAELPEPRWPPLPILAVDCPSGLNSDTGEVDAATMPAQFTVTFACPKWGQVQYPGAGACGVLGVASIGVPPELLEDIKVELVGPADIRRLLPPRPPDANKGTFGKALLVAGSLNYTGAAYLAAGAAGHAGAGLVTLAIPASLHTALASALPEATWLPLPAAHEGTHCPEGVEPLLAGIASYQALLVGPGLTTQPPARAFVEQFFSPDGLDPAAWRSRVVVDADCLNILAQMPGWSARLPADCVLTPHPGEMARLTGMTIADISAHRIETARRCAAEWRHVVLLKGAHTVVAAPDGRVSVLPFATVALATAGSGDVLAGVLVAMLAQGLAPYEAAVVAGYVHAFAGVVSQRELGPAGVVAGDIMRRLPKALRHLWEM